MAAHHLAQLNIAQPRGPLDGPLMADFMADLERLNALAEDCAGFVWRLTDDDGGDATSLRPFGPDTLVNMSVWESVEALRHYVYRTAHLESLRRRREWFSYAATGPHLVLWWVPAGHRPTPEEAAERLALLAAGGAGPRAFTLRQPFPAPATAAELAERG